MIKEIKEITDIFSKVSNALENIADVEIADNDYISVTRNDYSVMIPYKLFKYDSEKLIENKIRKLYE